MSLSGATNIESLSILYTKPFWYPVLTDVVMFYCTISSTDVAKGQYSATILIHFFGNNLLLSMGLDAV